ncbi:MAG TPA: ribonuclease III [Myxococcales bacterium]
MTDATPHLSPVDEQRVAGLEARLGMVLADHTTALAALTHASYVNEHPEEKRADNERLEFLGDAVVDLAVSDRLMRRYPEATEGELTRLRAALVDESGLAMVAKSIGLGELLALGRGEEQSGGRKKDSVLADALEAVIGVVFLAGGLEAAGSFVDRFFAEAFKRVTESAGRDFKSQLQVLAQDRFHASPRYAVVSESGPDHLKTFTVEIECAGEKLGRGEGKSKKEAEQAAAREALAKLPLAGG